MTSNDLIILEAINGLQIEMNQKFEIVNKRIDDIQNEIKEMKQEVRANTIKIEATQNSINTGFLTATLAITAVIAIVGFLVTLAPTIRAYFENKLTSSLEERMQKIAEKAINKALAGISIRN